jgi:pimeloyl-ACP methyl ester carboxylesterase
VRGGIAAVALLAALLAGCGGGSGGGAGTTTSTEAVATAPAERPELGACGPLPVPGGFRCGSIDVPLFRQDRAKGSTEIGFAIRRHSGPGPAAGTIVAVEGGPGYSSTGTANAYMKLFGSLLEDRDLLLIDERGTGRSGALGCPDLQRARAPEWIALSNCARRLGDAWEAYNTGAAAEDIDAVRAALGIERIALYGDSYGTYLAQAYAYRHPDQLDALVLDSAYPIRGERAWYASLPKTGIRSLAIACRRSPNCAGDPLARLDEGAKLLRESGRGVGPLIDAIGDAGAYGAPYSYLRVDRAVRQILDGRPGAYRDLVHIEKTAYKHRRQYSHAAELAISCNDYPMIWDRRASEEERRVQLEDSIRAYRDDAFEPFTPREIALSSNLGYLYCLTWPQPTELREPPVPAGAEPTRAPVLVVSGELDDVTTPYEGRLVTQEFPDAEHFVAPNRGHVASLYDSQGQAAREIRQFLRRALDGQRPAQS